MSVSRGALIAAVAGLAVGFALVPLRLRAAAVLAVGGAGGAAISGWALASHGLSDDNLAEHVRVVAGHRFGIVLLVVLAVTLGASWGLAIAMKRIVVREPLRRRISTGLVVLVALIPVGGVAGLAASSRGLTGEVSHIWSTLTNPNGGAGNAPTRLLTLSNSRTQYWSEGLKIGAHHLWAGTGALGFAVAHLRYATAPQPVSHAHDFWIETFADLGLIGVGAGLALFVAWAAAALRAVALRAPPAAASSYAEERTGLLTLAAVVLIFGLHSLLDWTWFIPGCAVVALACAGWLAGRGPLTAPVGRARQRRQLTRSPGAGMASVAIVAILIAAGWGVLEPLRSADADAAAIRALARGDSSAALTDVRRARAANPLALEPLYDSSAIHLARGELSAAREELLDAVSLEPQNPSPWQTLGDFDLGQRKAKLALGEFERAEQLDPQSADIQRLVAQARAAGG
jgi:hypothetical protein